MSNRWDMFFADQADEGAQWGLLSLMTGISEEFWAAGWMSGLEYSLWVAVEGGSRRYGMGELSERQVQLLRLLAEEAEGWWIWEGGPKFIPLMEWRGKFAASGAAGE